MMQMQHDAGIRNKRTRASQMHPRPPFIHFCFCFLYSYYCSVSVVPSEKKKKVGG
jgi:hypothetical protein